MLHDLLVATGVTLCCNIFATGWVMWMGQGVGLLRRGVGRFALSALIWRLTLWASPVYCFPTGVPFHPDVWERVSAQFA